MRHHLTRRWLMVLALSATLCVTACGERARSPKDVDKATFARAWAAYVALHTATSQGVPLRDYGPLVQQFATEVALLPAQGLTEQEQQDAAALKRMSEAYYLALHLWSLTLDPATSNDYSVWIVHQGQETFPGALAAVAAFDIEQHDQSPGEVVVWSKKWIPALWGMAARSGDGLKPRLAP